MLMAIINFILLSIWLISIEYFGTTSDNSRLVYGFYVKCVLIWNALCTLLIAARNVLLQGRKGNLQPV